MIDFDALDTFVAVVRSGNFSAAANTLRLPRSTVSQRVARLEAVLGVRLLERTTRVVRPTELGAEYYQRCARIISELEEVNAALTDVGLSPRGHLRVATPSLFGQAFLARIAAEFVIRYPQVEIEIVASDRRVNLVQDGFDVAIVVAANYEDSTTITRKLTNGQLWCCATRSYLAAHGTPRSPDELVKHDCIVNREFIANESGAGKWTFENEKETCRVDVRAKLVMNSLSMVHAAASASAGIALIPSFLCGQDVGRGKLVRLFPDWTVDRKDIRAIYPSNRHLSQRVRLFVEALAHEFTNTKAEMVSMVESTEARSEKRLSTPPRHGSKAAPAAKALAKSDGPRARGSATIGTKKRTS